MATVAAVRRLVAPVVTLALGLSLVVPVAAQPASPSPRTQADPRSIADQTASPTPASMTIAGTWEVLAFDAWAEGLTGPRPGTRLSVDFLPDTRLEGETGCGRYFGGYLLDGDRLSLGVTSKGPDPCDVPTTEEAVAFSVALEAVTSWRPGAAGLELLDAEGRVRLVLRRVEIQGLDGSWVVERYYRSNGTPIEPPPERPLTITFTGQGTIEGSTGCRLFDGLYQAQSDQLLMAPVETAGLPCEGDARRQERRFLRLLDQVVLWQREGDRLVLTDGPGAPLLELAVTDTPAPTVAPDAAPSPVPPADAPG